jgi:Glu-tRNA(Gln) amidotransferase subunit E-like FAD-binding protein
MTDTSTDDSDSTWDRLDDETAKAQLYPHEEHKKEWQQEAEEVGQSLSRYLYDLIQEARAYREGDLPVITSKDERVEELQNRIQELEEELDEARQQQQGGSKLTVSDLVEKELSGQYKTIDEILDDVKASDKVTQHLRRRIEDQLYSLTEEGEAEFQRGHGWRLAEGE